MLWTYLQEAGLLGSKPVNIPMEQNLNLWFDVDHEITDKSQYIRLVGKTHLLDYYST